MHQLDLAKRASLDDLVDFPWIKGPCTAPADLQAALLARCADMVFDSKHQAQEVKLQSSTETVLDDTITTALCNLAV